MSNVKLALSHNIGLGGAVVVGIYRLGFPKTNIPANVNTESSAQTSDLKNTTSQHKSGKFFEEVESTLKSNGPTLVSKVKAVIGFQVNCADGKVLSYVVDLKNASGNVFVNDGGTF